MKLSFRYPYFYFRHGESTSTASQLTSPASQKSKDLNKVSLLLQDLGHTGELGSRLDTLDDIETEKTIHISKLLHFQHFQWNRG